MTDEEFQPVLQVASNLRETDPFFQSEKARTIAAVEKRYGEKCRIEMSLVRYCRITIGEGINARYTQLLERDMQSWTDQMENETREKQENKTPSQS